MKVITVKIDGNTNNKLIAAIRSVTDDEDLVFCLPRLLPDDRDKESLIAFINSGIDVSHATIQLQAIDLRNAHENYNDIIQE